MRGNVFQEPLVVFNLRLPESLHTSLKLLAKEKGISLHAEVLARVQRGNSVAADEAKQLLEAMADLPTAAPLSKTACIFKTPAGTLCKFCGKIH